MLYFIQIKFYWFCEYILLSHSYYFTMFYVTLKINFSNKNVFKVPEVPKKVPEKKVPIPLHKKPEPPPAKGIFSYSLKC